MKSKMSARSALWFAGLLLLGPATTAPQWFELPALPRPAQYGNLLIHRSPETGAQRGVGFSHWLHRTRYACRVCHFELGFAMQINATEITEQANRGGEYCGACHDGKIAFAHTEENCRKCHSGDADSSERRFAEFRDLPEAPFGNGIDWNQAVAQGKIQPVWSLLDEELEPMPFSRSLELQAEWTMISPAVFPHAEHQLWHDCGECHPEPFNIKKKTTEHFEMRFILEGKFCGVCHLRVAFPLNDCWRCHPKMRRR